VRGLSRDAYACIAVTPVLLAAFSALLLLQVAAVYSAAFRPSGKLLLLLLAA